jgi:hypothetical protein
VYSQTWTNYGDDNHDIEFTVITREQFDRIITAQGTTASFVSLNFYDASEIGRNRVISGSRPNFNGFFYLSARIIPKNDAARIASSYIRAMVHYGNSRTGGISIVYLDIWQPNTISLKFNWNDYTMQFNQLLRLVNGD